MLRCLVLGDDADEYLGYQLHRSDDTKHHENKKERIYSRRRIRP